MQLEGSTLAQEAVWQAFGRSAHVVAIETMAEGYRNTALRLRTDAMDAELFLKIEKPFEIPRTEKHQIAREVAALSLCAQQGVPVPKVFASSTDLPFPWILESFVPGALIGSFENVSASNRVLLQEEFWGLFQKISAIRSLFFGDTFPGGFIGQHSSWRETLRSMAALTFEDCLRIDLFENTREAGLVDRALRLALDRVEERRPAVLFHRDFFSQNVIGSFHGDGLLHIDDVIDFGMSLYAPYPYAFDQTRRYSDLFPGSPKESAESCLTPPEQEAYEILRLEPFVLMSVFGYSELRPLLRTYVEKCRRYQDFFSKS